MKIRPLVPLLCVFVFVCLLSNCDLLHAQSDAERIRQLEARVAELERTVDALVKNRVGDQEGDRQNVGQGDIKGAAGPVSGADSSVVAEDSGDTAAAPPPAASSPGLERAATQQELLPSLGKIGASTFLDVGLGSGPFSLHTGSSVGGGLSLPVALLPGGRLNYEFTLGLAQNSRNLPITSSVAQLINLSILNALFPNGGVSNIEQAFAGTGEAPFAVTVPARWRAQTLRVTPLAIRYDVTHWDRRRFRPYIAAGLGTFVTVSNQVTEGALRQNADLPPATLSLIASLFGPGSPLSGSLLGGQIATAEQLKQSGIPTGQGGIDLGMQIGGGVEWRLRGSLSTAIDSRWNYRPSGGSYSESFTRLGWHF